MRVLHINFSGSKGGAFKIANEICKNLTLNGNKSELFCSRPGFDNYFIGKYPRLFYKIIHKSSVIKNRFLGDTHGIFSKTIINNIEKWNPDIVHLHNMHGGWFSLSLIPIISKKYKVVWTLHDEWIYTGHCVNTLECNNYEFGCGECPNLKLMVKTYIDNTKYVLKYKRKIIKDSEKRNLIMVPVSNWLSSKLSKSNMWDGKTEVIPNGIDCDLFNLKDKNKCRTELDLPLNNLTLIFVATGGIKDPFKNITFLLQNIELIKSSKPLSLIIIGEMQKFSPKIENITIFQSGYLSSAELLSKYFSASDLMIYPTKADSFGLVVAESMACGTPVFAASVGAMPEIIKHEINGYLYNPNEIKESIFSALNKLINDEGKIKKLSNNCREHILNNYSNKTMCSKYIKLYEEFCLSTDNCNNTII